MTVLTHTETVSLARIADAIGKINDPLVLDLLDDAIRSRRAALGQRLGADLKVGDTVAIRKGAPIRPAYLHGVPLRVAGVNRKTVNVDVIDPSPLPSKRYARGIRCPLDVLEKVG